MKLVDGNEINTVNVPLKTTNGSVSREASTLISSFMGAKPFGNYTMTCYNKQNFHNGKTYDNLTVYVNSKDELNENGKGLSTGFISYNDIPKAEKISDGLGGFTYDNKEVNIFWGLKLKEISEKFKLVANSTEKPEVGNVTESAPKSPEVQYDGDDDDLPF